jgi:hypothetical protein
MQLFATTSADQVLEMGKAAATVELDTATGQLRRAA